MLEPREISIIVLMGAGYRAEDNDASDAFARHNYLLIFANLVCVILLTGCVKKADCF